MSAYRPSGTAARVSVLFPATLMIAMGVGAANEETVFGRKIPRFKTVFIKVFHSYLQISSMEQLRTTPGSNNDIACLSGVSARLEALMAQED